MPPRAIVRDPAVLSGRWHLERTLVPIADILRDERLGRDGLLAKYRAIQLTDDELGAIFAFEFPAIREARVTVQEADVTVHCACGEATYAPRANGEALVPCPCRRTWRVTASLELIADNSKPPRTH